MFVKWRPNSGPNSVRGSGSKRVLCSVLRTVEERQKAGVKDARCMC